MRKKIENLKDWKPFLILLGVGDFQESSNDPLFIPGGELIFLGFKQRVSWVNIEIKLFLFKKCNVHIKLQEV